MLTLGSAFSALKIRAWVESTRRASWAWVRPVAVRAERRQGSRWGRALQKEGEGAVGLEGSDGVAFAVDDDVGQATVADADVRLREEGHVVSGEASVVPTDEGGLADKLAEARDALEAADWRVCEVVVTAVRSLAPQTPDSEDP